MTANGKFNEWALHAYVDNEISCEQRSEIEAMLQGDPDAARLVDDWRHQREVLKQTYDGVLLEPLPASLTATLNRGGRPAWRPYLAMAAAVALVMLGGVAGWFAALQSMQAQARSFAERAIVAHEIYAVEVRHPVEVTAAEKDHLQAWLSKRVGVSFTAPDLTTHGYQLLGGRLAMADDRPAAQLMYEDKNRNRITIFLASLPDDRETSVHVEQKGKLVACYWRDGHLAFAVAGEIELEPMMKLTNEIYDQFET